MADVEVEVVYAGVDSQRLLPVSVPPGSTVADAIDISGIRKYFPAEDLGRLAVGIWGREVRRDRIVADGDRVEIYRPLEIDPREARRRRAAAGQTGSRSEGD
jgi:putative ubiquitin-RnfH superfamily antitoxin RatB of RatAB toxin-antitoxin module